MNDPVHRPAHYTAHPSGVECITITEHMGFNLGNAVKYIWRADLKGDAVQDLEKARWYVDREIARRSRQEATETDNDATLATTVEYIYPSARWPETVAQSVPTLNDWERMVLAMVYAYPNKASAYTIANVIDYRDVGTDEAVGKRATATLEHLEELGLVHGVYSLAVCADAYDVTAAGGALAATFPVAPAAEQYDNSRSELLVRHAAGAVTLTDIEIRILDIIRERQDADPPRYLNAIDLFMFNAVDTVAGIRDALHRLEDLYLVHVHDEWDAGGTTDPEANHEAGYGGHTWELTAIGEKIARTHASRA